MRSVDTRQVLDACKACAAEIRAAAMDQGCNLEHGDRLGLFALATLIERRAEAKLMARGAVERAIEDMIGLLDALDVPDADCEPWLGAAERQPGASWGYGLVHDPGTDQAYWAQGSSDDRELDTSDDEETLGWPAAMRQTLLGPNTADGDTTAPERHGMGFVRCGPDEHEVEYG